MEIPGLVSNAKGFTLNFIGLIAVEFTAYEAIDWGDYIIS